MGHGGATAYLAILVLAGFARGEIASTVLVLNVLVAGLGFLLFQRAGHLRPRLLWPFLVTSVPAAFLGARVPLGTREGAFLLAGALLLAAVRLLLIPTPPKPRFQVEGRPFYVVALALGGGLGFLAGATGIGGGIFLSPVILLLGWATIKETASVSSAFIVLNSLSGLASRAVVGDVPDANLLAWLGGAVVLGGILGAFLGARRFPPAWVQRSLGIVLLVATGRTLMDAFGD